jgi:hypothetical protein
MPKYKIPVAVDTMANIVVTADTLADAIDIAQSQIKLGDNATLVCEVEYSYYQVNYDYLDHFKNMPEVFVINE